MGWAQAGANVTAIDVHQRRDLPQHPRITFVKRNALDVLEDTAYLQRFTLLAGGPPCQTLTRATKLRDAQGKGTKKVNLIPETREAFAASGVPYVIENVEDAARVGALRADVMLCGSMFPELSTYDETGRRWLKRHRVFELGGWKVDEPPTCCSCQYGCAKSGCPHRLAGVRALGVYASKSDNIPSGGQTCRTLEEGRDLMDIDWMSWSALIESIPPAYTRTLFGLFLRSLS